MNKKIENCIYCGNQTEVTDDHVPPKSFFPKPRPSNLITVSSCFDCNNKFGKDEEFFLASFMFTDAGTSDAGKLLWKEKLHRMYNKNIGLKRKIAEHLKPVDVISKGGIFLRKGIGVKPDEKRWITVVEKIIRGLYYFEYKEILPENIKMMSQFLRNDYEYEKAFEYLSQLRIGSRNWKDLFEYRYNRVIEQPYVSMWMVRFYKYATFWVITRENL